MSSQKILDLKNKNSKQSVVRRPVVPPSPPRRRGGSRRTSKLHARRRHDKALWALVIVLALACSAEGVSYITHLPQFTVQKIRVTGTTMMPPQVVSDYAETVLYDGRSHFLSRQSIFLAPTDAIANGLEKNFPRVATAAVTRDAPFSTTLTIDVRERQPFALWCAGGVANESSASSTGQLSAVAPCYVMDEAGFIYATAATSSPTKTNYVFSGGLAASTTNPIGQTFAPGHVAGLAGLLTMLARQDSLTPVGALVSSDDDFTIPLAQGFSLKASYGESSTALVQNLQLVLSSDALAGKQGDLDYVDLRFGDRVYYKFKGEENEHS